MRLYLLIWLLVFPLAIFLPDLSFSQSCVDWYRDADGDGFGTVATTQNSCAPVAGYVTNKLDCNDNSVNSPIWQRFGPGAFSAGAVLKTQITIGPDGTPYTAYRNFTADVTVSSIGVKKFNGSTWVSLGTDPISSSLNMYNPSLAVDSHGVVYLAFLDFDDAVPANNKVTVMKYNTTTSAWEVVGARRFSTQTSLNAVMNMAIDGNDIPYVAFSSAASTAVVMKYDAGAWQLVGIEGFADIFADEVTIAIGPNNVVYTAMIDNANGSEVSVMRYNSGAWEFVGGPGLSDDYVDAVPRIAIDDTNVPYVLYYQASSELILRRFNSTVWQDVGTSSIYSGFTASSADLDIDRFSKPYVVYVDAATTPLLVVKTLNAGNAWIDVAGGSYGAMDASVAIASDNIPYVSIRDVGNSERISVLSVVPQASAPGVPSVSASKSTTCAAETTTLSVSAGSHLNDAAQWVWYSGSCSGTSVGSGPSFDVSPSASTVYYVRAEGSCLSAPGTCNNVTVTVNQRPAITAQPAAAPKVCDQGNATLNVTPATGYAYQWYRDRNDGGGWIILTGETGSSLNLSSTSTSMNAYKYRVDVKNTGTGCITESATSVLTVNANPAINTQPVATQTICEGSGASISVAETGGGTYQWERYSGGTWNTLSPETAATLTIASTAAAMDNNQYRVTVSNSTTNCRTVSAASTLRVNVAPAIGAQPVSSTICAGGTATFMAGTSGTNLNYAWEEDRGAGFAAVINGGMYNIAANGLLTIVAVPASMSNYRYRMVLSNTGCSQATSNGAATLMVNTAAAINTQPVSSTICSGGTATFSTAATGSNLGYSWEEDRGAGFAAISAGGVYTIGGSGALIIAAAPATMTGYKYRVVLSNTGCSASTSNGAAVLTVNTAPAITADPANATVCVNNAVTFQATASGTNLSYQWQRNTGSGWSDISSETQPDLQIASAASGQNGYQYHLVVSNTGCTPVTSSASRLTVNVQPAINGNPADAVACVGSDAVFDITTNISGLSYQWQVNDGSGWTDLGGSTTDSKLTLISTTAGLDANQYRVVASIAGCTPVTSAAAVLTVNSASGIVAQPFDVTTCELGNASFAVNAVGTNLTYQWQNNSGSGWNDMPGETQTAIALSGVDPDMDTEQYRVRISTDACPDINSAAAVLYVHHIPSVAIQPADASSCAGNDTGFHVEASGSDLQWQMDDGSGWKDMAGETGADLLLTGVASSMNGYAYRLEITTPACAPVLSDIVTLTVNTGPGEGCGSLPLLISQGVSPNGDNKLDYWLIQGIEEYPDNTVKLYNVWGDLIFERNNYSNELNAWRGEANRGATVGGQHAPDGTYFYLIDLGNESPALRGFVVLKR